MRSTLFGVTVLLLAAASAGAGRAQTLRPSVTTSQVSTRICATMATLTSSAAAAYRTAGRDLHLRAALPGIRDSPAPAPGTATCSVQYTGDATVTRSFQTACELLGGRVIVSEYDFRAGVADSDSSPRSHSLVAWLRQHPTAVHRQRDGTYASAETLLVPVGSHYAFVFRIGAFGGTDLNRQQPCRRDLVAQREYAHAFLRRFRPLPLAL